MRKTIIVLFGPSGSGKSFIADRLCQMPNFSMIKKATDREIRTRGFLFRHFDSSIKRGGIKNGADYFDVVDGVEGDFLTENYGQTYSTSLSDIDSALEQYKVPVFILRTREQMKQLEKFYPDVNIQKFYLRPDYEVNKIQILNDKNRSEKNKQERISNLESYYEYHDETARLDKSVRVLINDYTNADSLVEEIVSSIDIVSEVELQNRKHKLESQICLGDKLRITYSKYSKEWKCDVIMNNSIKFSLTSVKSLADLIKQIKKLLNFSFAQGKIHSIEMNPVAENCLIELLDKGYVFDIQSSRLGFDCFFAKNMLCPDPPEDYDRDHDKMTYVSIGYKRCSSKMKTQSISTQNILLATSFIIGECRRLLEPSSYFNKENGFDYQTAIDKLKYRDTEFNYFADDCLGFEKNLLKQKQPD